MTTFNKTLLQTINPSAQTRSLKDIAEKTGNIYESIAICGKRAAQINAQMKEELHAKLQEFASTTDNLEEVFENREQIEISRFYEKLPHQTILALEEFLDDKVYNRRRDEE